MGRPLHLGLLASLICLVVPLELSAVELGDAVDRAKELIDDGRFVDARDLLARSLDAPGAQASSQRAAALITRGWAEALLGASADALGTFEQARALLVTREADAQHALLDYRVGLTYRDLGRYDEARSSLERALARYRALRDTRGETVTLDGLGGIAYLRANYSVAASLYQQALQRMRESQASPRDLSIALNNLAGVHFDLGDYDRAKHLYGEAVRLRREALSPNHPLIASALTNLGAVFEAQGDAVGAAPYFEEALIVGKGSPNEPIALDALGRARRMQGRSAVALDLHQEALRLRRQTLDRNDPYMAESLNNVAEAQLDLDLPELSRQHWIESLLVSELAGQPPLIIDAYDGLARTLAHQRASRAASLLGKLAVAEVQTVRETLYPLPEDLERGYTSRREPIYRTLSKLLIDQGRLPEASAVLDLVRNEELYAYTRGEWVQRTVAAVPLTEREQAVAQSFLDTRRALRARARDVEQAQQAYAMALEAMIDRVEDTTEPVANEAPAPVTRAIAADSARVHYVGDGDDALRIVVTTVRGAFQHQVGVPARELNQLIFDFRRQIADPAEDPRAAGKALHQLLLAPLIDELDARDVTHLQLSLDGAMRYVPFAALYDGERFAIERYSMTRVSMGSETPGQVRADETHSRAIAFGVTRESTTPKLPALPHVLEELETIVRRDDQDPDGAMPGQIYLDEQFSAATLASVSGSGVPNLHIASHFVFNPSRVDESFLLAGDGEQITLADFARLDLSGVSWVALSACETALAAGSRGLEIASLGALARARGADAVLASLWRVSDRATALFMRRLYGERARGENAATALRTAQLEALYGDRPYGAPTRRFDDPRAPYAHPYYWAPFVVMTE